MKLKLYKSCAGCIWYEEAHRHNPEHCSQGFLTEQTAEVKLWSTHQAGTNTAFVQIRPSIGCLKPYNAAKLNRVVDYIKSLGGWSEFQRQIIYPQIGIHSAASH